MSVGAHEYVNSLLLEFREIVVSLQEEQREWRRKLTKPQTKPATPLPSTLSSTTSVSLTQPTLTASTPEEPSSELTTSSHNLSTNTSSIRPPPYKTAVRIAPLPPARTRRRGVSSTSRSTSTMSHGRGALIVLEGLDRVGKSTLANKLVEHIKRMQKPVSYCRFPDRTTPVGKLIDEFLKTSSKKVDDRTMHLLFSANRWELNKQIRNDLTNGTTIVVDRYSYSGIAYSSAKRGLSVEWCSESEKGLPKPDLVIYLELPKEAQYKRPGFGDERFETTELQELVRIQYERLMDMSQDTWLRIDVDSKSPDQVLAEVVTPVRHCLEACANKEIGDVDFL